MGIPKRRASIPKAGTWAAPRGGTRPKSRRRLLHGSRRGFRASCRLRAASYGGQKMADFKLLNYVGPNREPRAGILIAGDTVIDLQEALPGKPWAASTLAVIGAWDEALPALHAIAA